MTHSHTAHTIMGASAAEYWDTRYRRGGTSGAGSHGPEGEAKVAWVNSIIRVWGIESIIDWGCGDGSVASRLKVARYTGLDVSPTVIDFCRENYQIPGWEWMLYDGKTAPDVERADLALSLDVIYHLVDDSAYRRYMELLFSFTDLVCVISSNAEEEGVTPHIRHRRFLGDVPRQWDIVCEPDGDMIGRWLFIRGQL